MRPREQHGRLIIVGAGGHAIEVAHVARLCGWNDIIHAVTTPPSEPPPHGRPVAVRLLDLHWGPDDRTVIAIGEGAARSSIARGPLRDRPLAEPIIHPSAVIDGEPSIGAGSVILALAYISSSAVLREHVHVNVGASVSHESVLDDFATIGPGARISGNVHIGRSATLGVGSSIINGAPDEPLTIGANAVIAGGACVIRDVAPDTMVAGVPASPKPKRESS